MSDPSEALIAWIKLPGIIDEDATSFRDITSIEDFIATFEKLFHRTLDGDSPLKARQMLAYLKENIPREMQGDPRVPEVNYDSLMECDFIELENATQLCLYVKCVDKENPQEFKEMVEQLNEYDREEILNLTSIKTQNQADLGMLVTKVRAYSQSYMNYLENQEELNRMKTEIDASNTNALVKQAEQKVITSLEEQKASIKTLEADIEGLKVEINKKKEENGEKEKLMKTDFKHLIESEKEKTKSIQAEIDVIDGMLLEMPQLKERIAELEEEEKNAKEELKDKRQKKDELERKVAEKRERRKREQAEIAEIEEKNRKAIEMIKKNVEESRQNLADRQAEYESIKTSPAVCSAIDKLKNARQERNDKKAEILKLTEQMTVLKNNLMSAE